MARPQLERYQAFVILLTLGAAAPAHSGPGDLDVRFGTHGQTEVPGQVDSAALIPLPDGRIFIFGVPEDKAARSDGAIAVARLLANGEPDATFGPAGHIDLRLGSEAQPVPTAALLLADGRILVAGYFKDPSPPSAVWSEVRGRSRAPGWVVRLSPDGAIDPTFGVSGVARAGEWGIDRIELLFDGAIAAAAPGLLQRLESNGTPAVFPGAELSTIRLGEGHRMSAMMLMQDGSLITSAGIDENWGNWDVFGVSVSGRAVEYHFSSTFLEASSFARDRDGTRLVACGKGYRGMVVERWQSVGTPDPTFASATGGRVQLAMDDRLGVVDRPGSGWWRAASCRRILLGSAGDHLVVGDWSKNYEYDGGRIVLAHLDASGAFDAAFSPSGRERELALAAPNQWSNWYVADAATASDGAVLLIARRTGVQLPLDYPYTDDGEQRTFIARVEISPSFGAGSIGFNDAAIRIAERRHGVLRVYRSGGATGPVSVRYELRYDSADSDDVGPATGTLTWASGDASPRTILLMPVDDATTEGEERFRVRLSEATGGAGLGVPEIEVTIEDDEALRALQFVEPAPRILEGTSADITITRPASTRGAIVVRYAVAYELDAHDGAPRPPETNRWRLGNSKRVGELQWNGDDVSSRTLQVTHSTSGLTNPDEVFYVTLADISGTLREGNGWKVARITLVDDPAFGVRPVTAAPATGSPLTPIPPSGSKGGGAMSPELLSLLALALLRKFRRAISPRRSARSVAAGEGS